MAEHSNQELHLATKLTVQIRRQTGEVNIFKVTFRTRMSKVFAIYAQLFGTSINSVRMLLDGERVNTDFSSGVLAQDDGRNPNRLHARTAG